MSLTIRLDDLLGEMVTPRSRHLVTRPTGAAVRDRIHRAMAATAAPATRLDFGEVEGIDFSCADEIVAKLLLETDAGHFVFLANVEEAHVEAIDHVLARQNLTIVAVPRGGGPCVLGATNPDLQVAFDAVLAAGPGDAAGLADRLAWPLERAADALEDLALRRLVVAAGGTFAPFPLT